MPTRYTVVIPDGGGGGGTTRDGTHPRMVTVMGGIPSTRRNSSQSPPPPPPPAQPLARVSSDVAKRSQQHRVERQRLSSVDNGASPPPPPPRGGVSPPPRGGASSPPPPHRHGSPPSVRRPRMRESGVGSDGSMENGGGCSGSRSSGRGQAKNSTSPQQQEHHRRRRPAPKTMNRAQVQQLQRTLRQQVEDELQWFTEMETAGTIETAEKQRHLLESLRKIVGSTMGSDQRLYALIPFLQRAVISPLLLQLPVPPPPPPSRLPTFPANEDTTLSVADTMDETWDTMESLLAYYHSISRLLFSEKDENQQQYRTTLMIVLAVLAEGTQLLQLMNRKMARGRRIPSPQRRRLGGGSNGSSSSHTFHRMMEDMVNPARAAKSIKMLGGGMDNDLDANYARRFSATSLSMASASDLQFLDRSGHSIASSDRFLSKSTHSDLSQSDDEVSIDSRLLRLMVDRASPTTTSRRQAALRRGSGTTTRTTTVVVPPSPARNAFSQRSAIAAMKLQKKFLRRISPTPQRPPEAAPATMITAEPPDEAAGGPRHVMSDDDTVTTKTAGNARRHTPAKDGHRLTRAISDSTNGDIPETKTNHEEDDNPDRYKAVLQEWNPSARLILQDLQQNGLRAVSVLVVDLVAVATAAEKKQEKDDQDDEDDDDDYDEEDCDMDELTSAVKRMVRQDIPQRIYHSPQTTRKKAESTNLSVTNTLAAFVQHRTAIRDVTSFFASRFPSEPENDDDDEDADDADDHHISEVFGDEEKAIMTATGIETQLTKASTKSVIRRAMHAHGPLLVVLGIIPLVPQWNAARRKRFWNAVRRYGIPTALSMLVAAAVLVAARGVQKWKQQRRRRRQHELQQNGNDAGSEFHVPPKLPTTCYPRTTATNKILDLLTQSSSTSTVLYGIRGSGKTTLASMAMRSITVGKRFYDGIVWLRLGDGDVAGGNVNSKGKRTKLPFSQNLSYPQVLNLYRQLCYQLATSATPSSSDVGELQEAAWQLNVDIYYLGEDEDGNLLEPFDENDFHDHRNDAETKRANLILALKEQLQARLQLSSRSVLIVLDGLQSLSDLRWFQFASGGGASQCHTLATFTTGGKIEKAPLDFSSLVCVEALSTEETMDAITMETDIVDSSDIAQIAREMKQIVTVTPLTVQWFLRLTHLPSIAPLDWCRSRRQEIQNGMNGSTANDDFATFIYAALRASYLEAERREGDRQNVEKLLFCFTALMGAVPDSPGDGGGGGGNNNGTSDPQSDATSPMNMNGMLDKLCNGGVPEFVLRTFWDELKTVVPPKVAARMTPTTTTTKKKKKTTDNQVSSVTQELVQSGLLVPLVPGDHKNPTYTVSHGILAEAGLRLLPELPWKLSPCVDKRKYFKLCLLRSYSSHAVQQDSSHVESTTLTWAVSNLRSVDLANEALDLMASASFVRSRLNLMGVLRGTDQHIRDAEELHRQLEPIELLLPRAKQPPAGKNARGKAGSSARIRVIVSYQCIANILTSLIEGDDMVDPCEAVVGIFRLGHSLARQGWYNEAAFMYNECLEQAQMVQAMFPESKVLARVVARSLSCLATIQRYKGDSVEAIKLFNEALGCMTNLDATDNSRLLESTAIHVHEGLGDCYRDEGEFYMAIQSYSKASIALEKASPPRPSLRASVLHRIGLACRGKGHWAGSKKCFMEELELRRSLPGSDHSPAFAESLLCLGVVLCQLGEANDAIGSLTESVEIWKRLIGVEKKYLLRYASSLQEIGQAYRQNGSLADALVAYKEALAVREAILGQNHADTAQTLHSIGVVYCDLGEQEEAMRAYALSLNMRTGDDEDADDDSIGRFRAALVNTQSLRLKPPSVRRIRQACRILFGEDILPLPCYTSRLFSCVALMVDRMRDESDDASTNSGGSGPRNDHTPVTSIVSWIGPLKPLLFAMVNAEAISVDEDSIRSRQGEPKPRRKIQFASHDFCSVPPPVDMVLGSNNRLEMTIDRLLAVLEEQSRMESENTDANGTLKEIPKVLLVLNAMTADREGAALREACAEAMVTSDMTTPLAYPQRFLTIAAIYRKEFEVIYEVVGSQASVLRADAFRSSPLRGQLSRLIESSIKYHLRRLFDPIPMGYTVPSEEHPARDFSACRARTDELLRLCPPDEGSRRGLPSQPAPTGNEPTPVVELTPLWERPLSHVFLLALHQLHAFLQCRVDVRDSLTLDGSGLCLTAVSDSYHRFAIPQDVEASGRFEPSSPSSSLALTDHDLDDLLADVQLACTCLSALRGADFIASVLDWPGVEDSIQEAGGWDRIQYLADAVARNELDVAFPDMGHLQLLRNIKELQKTISTHRVEMVTAASAGQVVIQNLWRRFQKKGVPKRRVVGKQQGMALGRANEEFLAHTLLDASCTCLFPCVVAPSYLMDDGV